ncbi:MAG TPA: chorismate mutase [Stellaceae bacterium]|nr:chorismate mutase [Stellaceae bacterium]
MLSTQADLDELRRRLDRIDDSLQDLLIERLEVVARVAAQKRNGAASPYVPSREAEMLRRLVARQGDAFPAGTLVRIWRELLGATTRAQGPFAVGAYAPLESPGVWDLARDHYSSHAPLTAYHTTFQVIRAVAERSVAVGVLPMPQDGDSDPWWRHLLSLDAEAPRVVARLPFGPRGNARSDNGDALVIGFGAQQPSGQDRTLLVTENAVQISRGRMVAAFSAIGLTCTFMVSCEHAEAANTLIEIDGFVPLDDARLKALRERLGGDLYRLMAVGGYAVPLELVSPRFEAVTRTGAADRAAVRG